MFMVHVVAWVVITVVARVGIVRVRRVVRVCVGRVGQRRIPVAVPCARAVRRAPAVLAVVAAVHGAGPTCPPARAQATSDILARLRTATSPHSYAQQPYQLFKKTRQVHDYKPTLPIIKLKTTLNRRPFK